MCFTVFIEEGIQSTVPLSVATEGPLGMRRIPIIYNDLRVLVSPTTSLDESHCTKSLPTWHSVGARLVNLN